MTNVNQWSDFRSTKPGPGWLVRSMLAVATALAIIAGMATEVRAQQTVGSISGTVVDAETGDPLIGATVMVAGLALGAMADLEGSYLIRNVPAGRHAVVVSMIGFARKRVTGIRVNPGQVTRIDLVVEQELIMADVVEVTARSLENTEASLLKRRQNALSISDAISAEDISRGAQGDVAAAMTRVTGASVVDGKYVYIRGLGERYSTAQLNGTSPAEHRSQQQVGADGYLRGEPAGQHHHGKDLHAGQARQLHRR